MWSYKSTALFSEELIYFIILYLLKQVIGGCKELGTSVDELQQICPTLIDSILPLR